MAPQGFEDGQWRPRRRFRRALGHESRRDHGGVSEIEASRAGDKQTNDREPHCLSPASSTTRHQAKVFDPHEFANRAELGTRTRYQESASAPSRRIASGDTGQCAGSEIARKQDGPFKQISSATPTNGPMKARFDWTFTTSDARSRKTRFRLLLPANRANRFPPLSSDCTNPLAFIWLSGFARVDGKDGTGRLSLLLGR